MCEYVPLCVCVLERSPAYACVSVRGRAGVRVSERAVFCSAVLGEQVRIISSKMCEHVPTSRQTNVLANGLVILK